MSVESSLSVKYQPGKGLSSKANGAFEDTEELFASEAVASKAMTGTYRCHITQLTIETGAAVPNFNDITELVRQVVAESGVQFGTVNVVSKHTTAAIKINENEPLLLTDMCERLERIFPKGDYYGHNNFEIRTHNMTPEECPNGHSHCQHLLLSTGETIPVIDGQMNLGRWQSLFLIELDRPLKRTFSVVVMGI